MSRLYEVIYNKDQWEIIGSRDEGYLVKDKSSNLSFTLRGDIIGIDQIENDTFLVHRRISKSRCQIRRLKFANGNLTEEFEEIFRSFSFVNDDTLFFEDSDKLYSISSNVRYHPPGDILKGNLVAVRETLEGKKVFCIEHKIISVQLPNMFDLVIVDAETFKPVTQAFSSLRNKLITLSDEFTFQDLVNEDEDEVRIIGNILFAENLQTLKTGKDTILGQCPLKI